MKFKILLLLLLCQGAIAQTLFVNSIDKSTGAKTIITRNSKTSELNPDDTVARNGMVFLSAGYQKLQNVAVEIYYVELNMLHKDNRLGCMETGKSKIVITFKDGTTAECSQISEVDCDPVGFTSAFALMPKNGSQEEMKKNFEKLSTTDINTIEVFTTEKSIKYMIRTAAKPTIKSRFALLDKSIKASK